MRDPLASFVRLAAVLVGAANAFSLVALSLWFAATGAEELEGLGGITFWWGCSSPR